MNVSGLLQGHIDSSLTEKGRNQAISLARELSKIRFDAIFASDLTRAKATADIIAKEHSLATKTTTLLRERKWGRLEGQTREALQQFDTIYQTLSDIEKKKYKSFKEVENDEELAARFTTFIREVAVGYPGKNVLLVSHGSAIGTFLIHIGFWSYQKVLPKIPNGAYIKFQSDGIDFVVEETKGFEGSIPRELRHSDK